MFALDPRLDADTVPLATLSLSRVQLMNDARFPWLVLVPARPGLVEIIDLDVAGRVQLMAEIVQASDALKAYCTPGKINVGALGNIVRQLHVHVVARREGDAAWPGPVWGAGTPEPYEPSALERATAELSRLLAR